MSDDDLERMFLYPTSSVATPTQCRERLLAMGWPPDTDVVLTKDGFEVTWTDAKAPRSYLLIEERGGDEERSEG